MRAETAGTFVLGSILGGIAAAAAVLLLTPMSGEKLRKKMLEGITRKPRAKRPRNSKKKAEEIFSNKIEKLLNE